MTGAISVQSGNRVSQLIPGRKKHFPAQLINEGLSIRIQVQRMNSELKALVVDDEAQVREFVSAVLRTEGWNVTQSASAEDAIEKLNIQPKNWKDLISGESFTRKDIITIQAAINKIN